MYESYNNIKRVACIYKISHFKNISVQFSYAHVDYCMRNRKGKKNEK